MKKIVFLFLMISLVFSSCQSDLSQHPMEEEMTEDTAVIQFELSIPQFSVVTKSGDDREAEVETIELYTFDADGIYLGKASALTMPDSQMKGTAIISTKSRIVHFVINATDRQTPAADGLLTERDIIPALATDKRGYWGRKEFTLNELKSPIAVELIRNYAKISFQGDKYPGTTFAIANNPKSAKVAIYNEDGNYSFEAVEEVVTTPDDLAFWRFDNSDAANEVMMQEIQYLFETDNATLESGETPTFLIALIEGRFYKLQLILSAVEACKIERNYHYEIVFAGFELDPLTGYDSFEAAAEGTVANNIFAEIIKHSPGIMDSKNNKIEVERLAYQLKQGNTLSIPANYFINGIVNNHGVTCYVKEGTDVIEVVYNEATGKIVVSAKTNGEAVILFGDPKGLLKREIKISVTDGFEFTSFEIETSQYDQVALRIGLPAGLDRAYFPLQLRIKAANIVPVQGLIIGYEEGGTTYYLYEVTEELYDFDANMPTTIIEIPFKVSLSEPETVTVDHTNFLHTKAEFIPQTQATTFSGSFYYFIYGCHFKLINGAVQMSYGRDKEEMISIHKGKVAYPFIAPKEGDVALSYYIDSKYAFTTTLDIAGFANDIYLEAAEMPLSNSATSHDLLVAAHLAWYRIDNGGSGNQASGAETQLSYMTASGGLSVSFNYQQTEPIALPDDVELVVVSRMVADKAGNRLYKAVATIHQLMDSNATITLVYDPDNNSTPWM